MPRTPEAPLSDTEVFEAYQAVASEVATVFTDPAHTQQRIITLGNYMLVCAIGTPESGKEAYDFVFQGGLLLAGLSETAIHRLQHLADRSDVMRYVYSLSYVPDTVEMPGIVRRPKSVTLREAAFIRGLLAAKKD